ncbi:MAG: Dyp-type peroxidase [Actinomycetota bacterium]
MASHSRRSFLTAAGAAAVAATAVGCTDGGGDEATSPSEGEQQGLLFPFRGDHQAGVTAPPSASGLVAGLDVRAKDRAELAEFLARLGESTEMVMSGRDYEDRAGGYPPLDTGILGAEPGPTGTSVVIGFGHSLFDQRFGLGDQLPNELQPMPKFFNDYLVRRETSGGDLSITVSADTQEATAHAFRQIMRETRGDLVPRWSREGFNHIRPDHRPGVAPGRNLLGFKDGTSNPDPADAARMRELVWIDENDGQPDWAVGGTYQAIRVIRMMVEFWDRTRLNEQEALIGRHRDSGAPLGYTDEEDTPVFDTIESHISRANPRTDEARRNELLRRGFNYVGGFDQNDQLDQGLIFVSYQRSLENGFIATQRRLDGEALEEYIRPLTGGFFFVPPPPPEGEPFGAALLG